jgi:ATP/maltotriose-dependent transcriptional regulator MalT
MQHRSCGEGPQQGSLFGDEAANGGLLAKGSTIRKVANALEIAERCVREHVEMVIEKLAVEDSTQAIAVALRNGIT